MNKILRIAMVCCLLFSQVAFAKPVLLYTQYIKLLKEPFFSNIELFSNPNNDSDRLVNIIITQSRLADEDNIDLFIKNIDALLKKNNIKEYINLLRRAKINALMIAQRFLSVIKEIDSSTQTQDEYFTLKIETYIQMNQVTKAVKLINNISEAEFNKNTEQLLDICMSLVTYENIPIHSFDLPNNGNSLLSQRYSKFLFKSKLYAKAFLEKSEQIKWAGSPSERNIKRIELLNALKKYNPPSVSNLKVKLMKDYLESDLSSDIKMDEIKYINDYTNQLVLYYSDDQYKKLFKSINMEKLIEKQRRGGLLNKETKILYYKNIIYIYRNDRTEKFYKSIIMLAKTTKNKQVINEVYTSKLSIETKRELLNAYFSLTTKNNLDLFMANELTPLIKGCEKNDYPSLIYALKGHAFVKINEYKNANICFKKSDLSELSTNSRMSFEKEKIQMSYLEVKRLKKSSLLLSIAIDSNDKEIQNDAVNEIIDNYLLTGSLINQLQLVFGKLLLSTSEMIQIQSRITNSLIKHNQKSLLMKQYEKNPNKNLLKITWLYMDDDDIDKTINNMIIRLSQGKELDAYSRLKIVRYLDSYYSRLTKDQLLQLHDIKGYNRTIQSMMQLNEIDIQLDTAFNQDIDNIPTFTNIQSGITEYNKLKARLGRDFNEDNETEKLFVQARLENKLADFFIKLMIKSEKTLVPLLQQKSSQLRIQSKNFLKDCINLKLEGIQNIRILQAIQMKDLLNEYK